MPTPKTDPTFQPGRFVFGYTMPGLAYFGNARTYLQQAIFGIRPFGGEVPGWNAENDIFAFRYGSPNPKSPYYKNSIWKTSISPWPVTPGLNIRQRGEWAKRICFQIEAGFQRVQRYTPYMGSPKAHLVPWAMKLSEAMFLWEILSDEAKIRLDVDAKSTGQAKMSHSYFVKLYMKDDPRWMDYV